jgi:hypothetical protein
MSLFISIVEQSNSNIEEANNSVTDAAILVYESEPSALATGKIINYTIIVSRNM